MLTARQPASPSDGEPPEIRPAAPLTSIQQFEAPDDDAADGTTEDGAAEGSATGNDATGDGGRAGPSEQPGATATAPAATAPAVGAPPAVWPPAAAAPGTVGPAGPARRESGTTRATNDRQTTSGVPATPIAGPRTAGRPRASPAPDTTPATGPAGTATPGDIPSQNAARTAEAVPSPAAVPAPDAVPTPDAVSAPAVVPSPEGTVSSGATASPESMPLPASAETTQRIVVTPDTHDPETTQRLFLPPAGAPTTPPTGAPTKPPAGARPVPGEVRQRVTRPAATSQPATPVRRPATARTTTEPATTEPVATQPVATQPATAQPATAQPATTEPVAADPAAIDMADDATLVLHLPSIVAPATPPADDSVTVETPVLAEAAPTVETPLIEAPTVGTPLAEKPLAEKPLAETPVIRMSAVETPDAAVGRRRVDLGRAPTFLAVSSIGVLLVALAYADGRDGIAGALTLYWVGQVVVFTPVAARLLWRRAAGAAESFMLVMGLAVNQFLLKWMYSPDQFRFPDELQHWLATTVLMGTDELFQPNPALPPAVHFPGLAEMGAAVADLTGLSVTAAGMLVAGGAHLLFVAALFALVLRLTDSPAVAGVACVVYATSLHYLFFNSMYLYATGALPFLMVGLWAVRRWRTGGGRPFAALAVVCMVAATATHHVTAFMFALTLTMIGGTELVVAGRPRRWSALAMPAVAFAVLGAWIAFVAPDVVAYLQAPADEALNAVAVLLGDKAVHGTAAPADVSLVQLAVQGAGLLVLFALYLGVGVDMLRRRGRDPWLWAVLIGGGFFFAGNGVRFLGQSGPEIAGRLNTFTYVPISIVAGIALAHAARLLPRRNAAGGLLRGGPPPEAPPVSGTRQAVRTVVATVGVTLLMVGARVGGWPPSWGLLPGPYLVGAYERSVDEAGVAAADWQRTVLGPGHRVGGDVTAVALSSTYGRQDPVRETAPLFYAGVWSATDTQLVRDLAIDYLVVDRRLATDLPALDAYFEHDPLAGRHTGPLTAAQLGKFDGVPEVDRLYDNGDIRIYRMGANR